jgi:cold shock CspA family protein
MGRSQQTFGKSEREKKRLKKKKEKEEKKAERKANAENGDTSLESMMVYVNEDGTFSDTPPDPTKKKKEINAELIEIGIPKRGEREAISHIKHGIVDFFNDQKGFGFIREIGTQEKYFVHVHGLIVDAIKENDKVSFELERGMKGMNAVRVHFTPKAPPAPVEGAEEDKKSEEE